MAVNCTPSPTLKLDCTLVKHSKPAAEPTTEPATEPVARLAVPSAEPATEPAALLNNHSRIRFFLFLLSHSTSSNSYIHLTVGLICLILAFRPM